MLDWGGCRDGRTTVGRLRRGHIDDVQDIAWAPDGSALATCSVDRTTVLWGAGGGPGVARLQDHKGFVQGAAWDPAAQFLVTQSSDRTCRRAAGCGTFPRLEGSSSVSRRFRCRQRSRHCMM